MLVGAFQNFQERFRNNGVFIATHNVIDEIAAIVMSLIELFTDEFENYLAITFVAESIPYYSL